MFRISLISIDFDQELSELHTIFLLDLRSKSREQKLRDLHLKLMDIIRELRDLHPKSREQKLRDLHLKLMDSDQELSKLHTISREQELLDLHLKLMVLLDLRPKSREQKLRDLHLKLMDIIPELWDLLPKSRVQELWDLPLKLMDIIPELWDLLPKSREQKLRDLPLKFKGQSKKQRRRLKKFFSARTTQTATVWNWPVSRLNRIRGLMSPPKPLKHSGSYGLLPPQMFPDCNEITTQKTGLKKNLPELSEWVTAEEEGQKHSTEFHKFKEQYIKDPADQAAAAA